jgi:nucleoside-diphosphate-sugar epimerase
VEHRILVTGADGFIGTKLCRRLNDMGADFMAMVIDSWDKPYKQFISELCNRDRLETLMKTYRPTVVVHLAGIASPTFSNSSYIYEVNTIGTDFLLASIRNAGLNPIVIEASTAGIYGNQPSKLYSEDLPAAPANHYSCSKFSMECISRNYADDMRIVVLRPFSIIGVGQSEAFIVPKLVKAFAERQKVLHLGNTKPLRDFVDVEKLVDVIVRIVENPPDVDTLNVCTGIGHSIDDVIASLSKLTGFVPEVVTDQSYVRKNEVWRLVGDPTLINAYVNGSLYVEMEELLGELLSHQVC